MSSQNVMLRETGFVFIGEILCTAVMVCIFVFVGHYDISVLLGGIVGAVLASANFFLMVMSVNAAADKAEHQDIKSGQALLQISYIGRIAALFLVLALCAGSGKLHILALVLPLAFVRPSLTIGALFQKKGVSKA